jgi:hypothetical protein
MQFSTITRLDPNSPAGRQGKNHLYKTARIKGLNLCYVAIISYEPDNDSFFIKRPYGDYVWVPAADLESFCL